MARIQKKIETLRDHIRNRSVVLGCLKFYLEKLRLPKITDLSLMTVNTPSAEQTGGWHRKACYGR